MTSKEILKKHIDKVNNLSDNSTAITDAMQEYAEQLAKERVESFIKWHSGMDVHNIKKIYKQYEIDVLNLTNLSNNKK